MVVSMGWETDEHVREHHRSSPGSVRIHGPEPSPSYRLANSLGCISGCLVEGDTRIRGGLGFLEPVVVHEQGLRRQQKESGLVHLLSMPLVKRKTEQMRKWTVRSPGQGHLGGACVSSYPCALSRLHAPYLGACLLIEHLDL